MKVVLIDDEPIALENLKYVIGQYDVVEIAGAFTDPLKALQKLDSLKPEAVFLDIEMPQVNGFTVAEEIYETLPGVCIVFVTGFNEYAVKAFEINAIDYIIKPVSRRRLEQAISKLDRSCRDYPKGERTGGPPGKVLASMFKNHLNKIIAWKDDKIMLISPEQALYFYAAEGGVAVVTDCGHFRVRETLSYWEERLSEYNFFRCHRAFLINLNKIEIIQPMFNNTYDIKLANHPGNIPVSRKYARQLKQILRL